MIRSMTGFATFSRDTGPLAYTLELRAVNGRGLELKLRCPEPFDAIENDIRGLIRNTVTRGSVMFSLRVQSGAGVADGAMCVDLAAAQAALGAVAQIDAFAKQNGTELAPTRAGDILGLRGVMAPPTGPAFDMADMADGILDDVTQLLEEFNTTRHQEGTRLAQVIADQLDRFDQLVGAAIALIPDRDRHMGDVLRANIAKLQDIAGPIDHEKIAQEIAILLVKQDVTEELDRLQVHISAARDMLATGGPIGRKFDFLTQEFNREANTLCSKSQFTALTKIGLEMKSVIDQIREQIQNIE